MDSRFVFDIIKTITKGTPNKMDLMGHIFKPTINNYYMDFIGDNNMKHATVPPKKDYVW